MALEALHAWPIQLVQKTWTLLPKEQQQMPPLRLYHLDITFTWTIFVSWYTHYAQFHVMVDPNKHLSHQSQSIDWMEGVTQSSDWMKQHEECKVTRHAPINGLAAVAHTLRCRHRKVKLSIVLSARARPPGLHSSKVLSLCNVVDSLNISVAQSGIMKTLAIRGPQLITDNVPLQRETAVCRRCFCRRELQNQWASSHWQSLARCSCHCTGEHFGKETQACLSTRNVADNKPVDENFKNRN